MKATELFLANGKSAGVFYCGSCRNVFNSKESADSHCRCQFCNEGIDNNKIGKGDYSSYHGACWTKHHKEREAKKLAEAEVVTNYDGWIYAEGRGYRDGYFESMDCLVELLIDHDIPQKDWPEKVYCCKAIPFPKLEIDDILESHCEELHESVVESLSGVTELESAMDCFNRENEQIVSYECDETKTVVVPREKGA